jgi:hypothetical protein
VPNAILTVSQPLTVTGARPGAVGSGWPQPGCCRPLDDESPRLAGVGGTRLAGVGGAAVLLHPTAALLPRPRCCAAQRSPTARAYDVPPLPPHMPMSSPTTYFHRAPDCSTTRKRATGRAAPAHATGYVRLHPVQTARRFFFPAWQVPVLYCFEPKKGAIIFRRKAAGDSWRDRL